MSNLAAAGGAPAPAPVPAAAPAGAPPPGFEIRKFNGRDVYITTLHKGTVLFRGLRSAGQVREDIFGLDAPDEGSGDSSRRMVCLPPHYNVFFYPFPFVDATVGRYKHTVIYCLVEDVKVAVFISPSPMTRGARLTRGMPIQSCSDLTEEQHGCGMTGRDYDPCFNHQFLTNNPDVTGMIAIADADRLTFLDQLEAQIVNGGRLWDFLGKYYSAYTQSAGDVQEERGVPGNAPGIPEIILYPRTVRSPLSIYTRLRDIVDLRDAAIKTPNISFIPVIVARTDPDWLKEYLDKHMSPDKKEGFQFLLDKRTGFYMMSTVVNPETVPYLVPFQRDASGTQWNTDIKFPEFIFTRGTLEYVMPIAIETYYRRKARAQYIYGVYELDKYRPTLEYGEKTTPMFAATAPPVADAIIRVLKGMLDIARGQATKHLPKEEAAALIEKYTPMLLDGWSEGFQSLFGFVNQDRGDLSTRVVPPPIRREDGSTLDDILNTKVKTDMIALLAASKFVSSPLFDSMAASILTTTYMAAYEAYKTRHPDESDSSVYRTVFASLKTALKSKKLDTWLTNELNPYDTSREVWKIWHPKSPAAEGSAEGTGSVAAGAPAPE